MADAAVTLTDLDGEWMRTPEVVRQKGVPRPTLNFWVRGKRVRSREVGTASNGKALLELYLPDVIACMEDPDGMYRARRSDREHHLHKLLRGDPGAPVLPGMSWLGVREAGRKYGVTDGTIRNWIRDGLIEAREVQEPSGPGKQRLVDEYAVWRVWASKQKPGSLGRVSPGGETPTPPSDAGAGRAHAGTAQPTSGSEGMSARPSRRLPSASPAPTAGISSTPSSTPSASTSPSTGSLPQTAPGSEQHRTADLVDEYQAYRMQLVDRGRLSLRTVKDHWLSLRTFAEQVPIFPWAYPQLEAFVFSLPKAWSGTRTHTLCAHVQTFQSWLERRFPDERLPSWKGGLVPGLDVEQVDPLTPEQAEAIIAAASGLDQAMIVLFRETGIRPFELRDLAWEELTPEGWTTKGRGKTKRKHYVPIADELYDYLRAVSPSALSGGYVFPGRSSGRGQLLLGTQLAETATYPIVARYFRESGVEADRSGPYMFRHTFIMAMKETVGVELTSLMVGHADIAKAAGLSKMTIQTYGKHSELYLRDQYLEAREKLGWRVPTAPRQGSMDEALAVAS